MEPVLHHQERFHLNLKFIVNSISLLEKHLFKKISLSIIKENINFFSSVARCERVFHKSDNWQAIKLDNVLLSNVLFLTGQIGGICLSIRVKFSVVAFDVSFTHWNRICVVRINSISTKNLSILVARYSIDSMKLFSLLMIFWLTSSKERKLKWLIQLALLNKFNTFTLLFIDDFALFLLISFCEISSFRQIEENIGNVNVNKIFL